MRIHCLLQRLLFRKENAMQNLMDSEQKLRAFRQKAVRFSENYNAAALKDWFCGNGRDEIGEILRQADSLMQNTFTFTDRWDMEPCAVCYRLDPLIWDVSPNGDPEWVYMLNRHEYLKKLLLAGWYTGTPDYFLKAKEFILHWIDHNTVGPKASLTTRTIDTGIRCANWLPVLVHLTAQDLLTDQEILTVIGSIREQFLYLKASYVPKYTLSNWGVLQTSSILLNSLWLDGFLEPEIVEWAEKELLRQLSFQIYEDGSHWEQSIMYHIEVLNCVSTWLIMKQQLGMSSDTADETSIRETLHSMYRYVQMAAGPDHIQPAQGDSDCTDVRDVLSRGALLFSDPQLRFGGYEKLDLDNVWFFGTPGLQAFQTIPAKAPAECCGRFPVSGNYFFRTGWDENASYTYLHNGPLGSSHGHVDLTHISNYFCGRPFLVDSGRYSYVEEEPLRGMLKDGEAHNVCIIDDARAGLADGSWSYAFFGDSLKNYEKTIEDIHYGEMPFLSREPEGGPAFHNRQVLIFPEGIWFISDDLRMEGTHKSRCRFHFSPEVAVVKELPESGEVLLENSGIRLKLGACESLEKERALLSRRYNETEEHWVFTSSRTWHREGQMISWLIPENAEIRDTPVYQAEAENPCPPEQVTAKEVWLEGKLIYVILLFRHEIFRGRKIFSCHGTDCRGKVLVLKNEGGAFRALRFKA